MREAIVTFKDRHAATLRETAGGSRFSYADGWTETIACALPADRRDHDWPNALHPFFQHLAAEGNLRRRQARSARLDEQDDLGLLLHFGADCIGAVGVLPAAEAAGPQAGAPRSRLPDSGRRSISGVQRKRLVSRRDGGYAPAGEGEPATHIAKLNDRDHPDLVRNEALCLRFAATLLGPRQVAESEPGVLPDGEQVLLVRRFDRTAQGAKLRMEDFAQILSRGRGRAFDGKFDGSHEQVAAAIRKHSAAPLVDLAEFFRRVVVNLLLGNGDAHLKNWSLLETGQGLRLSPAYDILNTMLYPEFSTELALALGDERPAMDRVDRGQVLAFGDRIGLPRGATALALADLAAKIRRGKVLDVPDAEPADGFRNRFADVVRGACQRILEP